MIVEALTWLRGRIEAAAPIQRIQIHGREYTDRPLYESERPKDDRPGCLELPTLTGFCAYVAGELENPGNLHDRAVFVLGPQRVELMSAIHGRAQRTTYASCSWPVHRSPLIGKYLPVESAAIELRCAFGDTLDRAKLVEILGNVAVDVGEVEQHDDGIGQPVAVKPSAHRLAVAEIPQPAMLDPRWSFADVNRHPVPFIVRVRPAERGEPQGLYVGLFEAAAPEWATQQAREVAEVVRSELRELSSTLPVYA